MNKQEKEDLIQALYDIGGCEAEDEWARGYDDGVNAAIDVIKELKVQGKVIFSHEEKFVADWLDGLKGEISDKKLSSGAAFMVFVGQQLECLYYNEYTLLTDDVEGWLLHPENKVKLLNAIDNGYEVEKEQLYAVKGLTDYFRYENKVILFNDKQEALDIANKIGECCEIEEFDYANNSNFILSREF
ncbi:DUF1642 domain-containing protein [Enterococcus faecalis]|uniref:DUF1642 domain-containing protein n=1 Tax=Enterococcus faecalis TaxID=1351 RepID=UPI002936C0EB|nr:DUF1642 domain-containing protein [Enterococcus faecalis]MDV2513016.1 DUF1642 domain-containing protein [Enterococcus faecalis]